MRTPRRRVASPDRPRPGSAGRLALIGLLTVPLALSGQQPAACADEKNREFDFWVGDWDVTVVGTDQHAGTNSIQPILGGCVLLESYETPRGYAGHSYNAYDGQTGKWHQTWVDNAGLVLKIDGGIVEGNMVLSGPGKDSEGNDIINRITWTPLDDGSVQQTWDVSSDGGQTWSTAFDGLYRRRDK